MSIPNPDTSEASKKALLEQIKNTAQRMKRAEHIALTVARPNISKLNDRFLEHMAKGDELSSNDWRIIMESLIKAQFPGASVVDYMTPSGRLEAGQVQFTFTVQWTSSERDKRYLCLFHFEGDSSIAKIYKTERAPFEDAILFDMLLDLLQTEAETAAGMVPKKRRLTVQERLDVTARGSNHDPKSKASQIRMSTVVTGLGAPPSPELLEQIKKVADRMKRPSPTVLATTTGVKVELSDSTLDCLSSGRQLNDSDWKVLVSSLVLRRVQDLDIVYSTDENAHEVQTQLAPGRRRFTLIKRWISTNFKMPEWSCALRIYEGASSQVQLYMVRETFGAYHAHSGSAREALKSALGLENWQVKMITHQETPLQGKRYAPFQDALLFDMLLDLAIDGFQPHTRTIDDGPSIMLEILEALEHLQKEIEDCDGTSGKRLIGCTIIVL
ncbi:hypothetical protein N0V90_003452 [Kalmusia sp. IMI 367209]|nr:hypothetical protein N0V90_003452 [Kalmusia sp. IMI 367209]